MSATPEKPKRRIMLEFEIAEISAVDNPAQTGAKAMIVKRKNEPADDEPVPVRKFTPVRDEAWKREADAILKDAFAALGEERAELREKLAKLRRHQPGKENTMFRDEVAKARAGGASRQEAMRKARKENPAAYEAHQREGRETAAKANARVTDNTVAKQASDTLTAKARELATQEKIPLTQAMIKVRKANPDLYALTSE